MTNARQLWLILVIVLTACAPHPTGSTTLSGSITGLDPGAAAYLRLEHLTGDQVPGQGQLAARFSATNGPWEQTGLALEPGRYGLFPEAEGYVSRRGSTTFEIMSADGNWQYRQLDFELFRPEEATERVGVPLCTEPPAGGGVYVAQAGGSATPTPTRVPVTVRVTANAPLWPPGTCYAGQYQHVQYWVVGIQGVVSGLDSGQVADILVYVLPPVPGETYFMGEPPPEPDGSWQYPDALSALAEAPRIGLDEALTMRLRVGNGPWGVMDPGLAGQRYLVLAQAPGLTATPPAYGVVVFDGKGNWPTSGVDFVFEK